MQRRPLLKHLLRKSCLMLLPLAMHFGVQAQTANQYTAVFTTGASLVTQSSPTTLTSAPNDDNVTATAQAIGFSFLYENVAYSHFVVTPDGLMKLLTASSGTGANEPSNSVTSTTNVPKLMPFWDDLALGGSGGYVKYSLQGTSPNRRAVIEWFVTIPKSTSAAANTTFQVVLNEGTNVIEYIYSGTPGSGSLSASSGLGGSTAANYLSIGTAFTSASNSTATNAITAYPSSGTKVTFTPPILCSGIPNPGVASATPASVCVGYTTSLLLTNPTSNVGNSIQWQVSTDHTTWNNITGATAATYVATPTVDPTYYRAKVYCSFTNDSNTSNTLTVNMANPAVTTPANLPFTESFETWINSCSTGDRPSAFWVNTPTTGNQSWRRDDNGAGANWTNPATGAYTPVFSAGARSARFHSNGAATGTLGTLDAYLNFSSASSKVITFDYINTNGTDSLIVELSTDNGATFKRLVGVRNATGWTPVNVLSTDVAATAILRFRGKSDAGTSDIGLDNVRVYLSSCVPPTAPAATIVTPNSVSINATVTGTPMAYQVQYGPTNFAAGSGTSAFGTSLPLTVSGLLAGTRYNYFIRSICSAGDTSAWSTRDSFLTTCGSYPLPFLETFNTYLPNTCWTEATGPLNTSSTLTGTTSAWIGGNYLNAAATNPAAKVTLAAATLKEWLISPSIALGTPAAGTNFAMEFNLGIVNNAATTPATMGSDDSVAVVISTDNGVTWSRSNIVRLFRASNTPINATTGAQKFVVPLEGYSGTIKVGFYGTEGSVDDAPNYDVFVDSFRVYSCNIPTVNLGNDTTLCSNVTLTLNAGNAGSQYQWSNSVTTQTNPVNTPGTYSVLVTTPTGCFGRDTIVLTGSTAPTVNLGVDTAFCPGDSVTLNAGNAGASYLWSNSATTQTITVKTGNTYSVRVTTTALCVGRDTAVITAAPNPVVNLGNDTAICPGTTLTLDAKNPGSTYLYNQGATTQTLPVTTAGTYYVRVTSAAKCVGRDTIVVGIAPVPSVFLGNDTARCPGATIILNAANTGSTYLWSTGATTQSINVTAAGTYSVVVTNSSKCTASDAIIITAGTNPVVNLGNDTTLCTGVTLTLNAGNAGSTYLWSANTGAVTTQTYATNAAGTYSVRVTNAQKCVGRDTITLTAVSGPVVNLGNDTALCPGQTITLDAGNPGATYLWTFGSTNQTLAVTTPGTYQVRVTNGTLCVATDVIVIAGAPVATVNLGNDTTVCQYVQSLIIGGTNPTYTYSWNTGQVGQTVDVAPYINSHGVPGSFVSVYVVATNTFKCQASDAKVFYLTPIASVNTISKVQSGLGSKFSSDAANSTYYRWDFGDGVSSNDSMPIHYYPTSGTYQVRLIVGNACYYDTAYSTLIVSNVGVGTLSGSNEALRVYPNPATGLVTVECLSNGGMQSVRILNTVGAVVVEKTLQQSKKEMLDLAGLPAGNYLIQVKTAEGLKVQRIQLTR